MVETTVERVPGGASGFPRQLEPPAGPRQRGLATPRGPHGAAPSQVIHIEQSRRHVPPEVVNICCPFS
jgi:hypothetical protein